MFHSIYLINVRFSGQEGVRLKTRLLRFVPCLMLCAGILLIALGVWRGEAEIVFEKAIRICLECVGIG